jgi:hypothetical protein
MHHARKAVPFVCVLGFVLASPARADLVVNGGFETGTLSGWTVGGNINGTRVHRDLVHTGAYGFETAARLETGFLTQSIATIPGATYSFSFWLKNTRGGDNQFTALWDGATVFHAVNLATSTLVNGTYFSQYTFQLPAADSSTEIRFVYMNGGGFFGLDDVSVQLHSLPVPEPADLALALAAAAWVWRVRRSGTKHPES